LSNISLAERGCLPFLGIGLAIKDDSINKL